MELSLSPAEIAAKYAAVGTTKAKKPTILLVVLGILAGMLIALGSATTNTAVYGMEATWTARTICALIFPFGLGMVMIMGAELFTGNCMIITSVLDKRCSMMEMFRNWIIIYLSNFVGALLVAAGCAWFGQMDYSGGLLAVYTMKVAAGKCGISFANGVVMGILCNLLVSMGVLMSLAGKDATSRILGAYLPVSFFVLCGFEHCVANMYYITVAKAWSLKAAGYMLVMVLGNAAGGVIFPLLHKLFGHVSHSAAPPRTAAKQKDTAEK